MNPMSRCIIWRAIPGSGKSSLTAECYPTHVVCSADHYHVYDGVYVFKRENAAFAHGACLEKFLRALEDRQPVIVDNTNLEAYSYSVYYRLAEIYGYKPEIISIIPDVVQSIRRNVHAVPPEIIQAQEKAWYKGVADMPVGWNHKIWHPNHVSQLLRKESHASS